MSIFWTCPLFFFNYLLIINYNIIFTLQEFVKLTAKEKKPAMVMFYAPCKLNCLSWRPLTILYVPMISDMAFTTMSRSMPGCCVYNCNDQSCPHIFCAVLQFKYLFFHIIIHL